MKLDSLNGYFYEDRFQVGKSRDILSLKNKNKKQFSTSNILLGLIGVSWKKITKKANITL